jgi:hypothetical protein
MLITSIKLGVYMTSQSTSTEVDVQRAPLSPELVAQFAAMAMMIESETTDAVESIVAQILAAPGWDTLDAPWETTSAEQLRGRIFTIDRLTRRPSQFRDGLGLFLVVHSTDARTGETFVWTSSATGVVAQLVRAYAAEWLPLFASLVIAERPTESGYYPHHLKFHGPSNPLGRSGA